VNDEEIDGGFESSDIPNAEGAFLYLQEWASLSLLAIAPMRGLFEVYLTFWCWCASVSRNL
jgi:hypothetical protein